MCKGPFGYISRVGVTRHFTQRVVEHSLLKFPYTLAPVNKQCYSASSCTNALLNNISRTIH